MKVEIENSFIRDTKKASKDIQHIVPGIIQIIRDSQTLTDIPKIKKMAGPTNAYRIRIGDYRLGLYLEGETVVSSFIQKRNLSVLP